jgi:hypothetical protein
VSDNPISKAFAVNPAGKVVSQTPEQVAATQRGGYTPVSEEMAHGLAQAAEDKKYVDENWGTAGQAAVGAVDGATLGLGPALATQLGLVDRGHLEAAQQSGAYGAGEAAGFLVPAIASGGEGVVAKALSRTPVGLLGEAGGLAERVAGRLAPEAGLLGKTGSQAVKMAARGGTENALMNVAHQASDDIINNKPLAAQAMLATGAEGALFGVLLGGALGGAGSAIGRATEGLSNKGLSLGLGNGERSAGVALKRVGLDAADYATKEAGAVGAVRDISDLMKKGETSFAAPTSQIRQRMEAVATDLEATANSALKELGQVRQPGVQPLRSLINELDQEFTVMYRNTAASAEAEGIYKKLKRDLEGKTTPFTEKAPTAPTKPEMGSAKTSKAGKYNTITDTSNVTEHYANMAKYNEALKAHESATAEYEARKAAHLGSTPNEAMTTWEQWAKNREVLADRAAGATGLRKEIYDSALQKFDAQFRAAGEAADPELFQKYASAATQRNLAKTLVESTGEKMGQEAGRGNPLHLNQTDGGAFGLSVLYGNPVSGAGIVAARKITGYAQDKLEPVIAEYAARSAIGAKAGAATAQVGERISGALRSFMRGGAKAAMNARAEAKASEPTAKKLSYTMKAYQEAMDTADLLTSEEHQQRVRDYMNELTLAGHPELANEFGMTYGRAVADVRQNRPKSTLRDKSGGSLGKTPKQMGLDTQTMKFMRRLHSMRDPVGTIVNGLEQGNLSRDAIASIKYVMPDLHHDLVMRAAQEAMAIRQEGKFLPADKLALLGVALDHPVDSKLSAEFIGEVQQALAANSKPQPKHGDGPPPVTDISSYQTPLQSSV